ncbi:MAG TPA: hypothetical protein VMO26_02315 [Vicinamibacterales bacterium]|nr:hypothetical protein [Vicinamibacterales bacterium]
MVGDPGDEVGVEQRIAVAAGDTSAEVGKDRPPVDQRRDQEGRTGKNTAAAFDDKPY